MSHTAVAARPDAALYAGALLDNAPRVLSLMDREVLSPTAGCLDRTYWAWKFTDFPGARFQEGLCTLAFLHAAPIPGNPFHRSTALLRWIDLGFRFWTRLQHRDGSFDEAYPFERSLAATAFTGFYIAEALDLLRPALPADTVALVQHSLARAGHWLCRNDETHGFLSNHLAAAAAALYHVFRVTGEAECERRSRYFRDRILAHQSAEGWYDEYGGADPGYQTHGTFYLARLWQLSGNEELAESLGRSTAFLAHFVHPDGSLGGEYASRNTQTYYPAAFEILAVRDPAAAWIAERMRASVPGSAAAGLRAVDAYNYFPVLNNLAFAYAARAAEAETVPPVEPSAAAPLVWFPEAGIARVRTGRYDAYVGTAKGGVVKVFDRRGRRLVYSDCGYLGVTRGGRLASTQYQDGERAVTVTPERIAVHGAMFRIPKPVMRPFRFVGFRLFSLTVGRLPGAGRWLKKQLVRVLIYSRRPLDVTFVRRITFGETTVTVEDELSGPDGRRLASLVWADVFTTIHMGSSRYFVASEAEPTLVTGDVGSVEPQRIASGIRLRRAVSLDQD